jgi:hypothetical protein
MFFKKTSLSLVVGLFIALNPQISTAKDYSIGTIFRDMIQYDFSAARLKVPLPPGNWKLLAKRQSRTDPSNVTLETSYFIRHDQRLVTGLMKIVVPREMIDSHWGASKNCSEKRKRRAWYVHDDSYEKRENCTIIFPLRGFRRNSNRMHDISGYIDKNHLVIPNSWIFSRFARTYNEDFLTVDYALPQEHYGFQREKKYSNTKSPWSVDNISSHPKKKAFMKKANAWIKSWKGLVDSGFKNKLNKESVRAHPRIDGTVIAAPAPAPVPKKSVKPKTLKSLSNSTSSIESRLTKLKTLHDKGLITDSEYNAKKEKVLEGL